MIGSFNFEIITLQFLTATHASSVKRWLYITTFHAAFTTPGVKVHNIPIYLRKSMDKISKQLLRPGFLNLSPRLPLGATERSSRDHQ